MTLNGAACLWSDAGINTGLLVAAVVVVFFLHMLTVSVCARMQSFLKHKDAKPLRDVLASNPNRFVPLLVPAGTAATVRPGSPSTTTARLDLQFQAIKVCFSC